MQRICNKYANICIEYAQNMQKIYAQICKYMQFICKNMQIYAAQFVPQKYAKICKNMQSICMLYAKTCKICNHVFYMQNMQKYALPTLLMTAMAGVPGRAWAWAAVRPTVPVCGMETAARPVPVRHNLKKISMTSLDIEGYLFEKFTDDIQLKYLCKY